MRLLQMQLRMLDSGSFCSIFVLMMHGHPLSATLPEDSGLGERFWYWRGASGQRYIHSIYSPEHCPPLPGAVFVVVKTSGGQRRALGVGRFDLEGRISGAGLATGLAAEVEIHVHLLARDEDAARHVLRDLQDAMGQAPSQPLPELRSHVRPVQLELLAA